MPLKFCSAVGMLADMNSVAIDDWTTGSGASLCVCRTLGFLFASFFCRKTGSCFISRTGGKDFGINTTFYDRGIRDLVATVRHHRPDLAP